MKQSTILPVTSPNDHQFTKFFRQQIEGYMCSKVTHNTLNGWLYYIVIYHQLQCIVQIIAIFDIHISQGSVATCLRRGGILNMILL